MQNSSSSPRNRLLMASGYRIARDAIRLTIAWLLFYVLIEWLAFEFAMPRPYRIFAGLRELIDTGTLQQDVVVTSVRWMVGWMIGATLGVAVGIGTSQSRSLQFTSEWFLTALRAIPSICLVPLSVRFFGYHETGKYFVVAWAVFFICWVGTHQAALQLPEYIGWNTRSLGLSNVRKVFYVVLPQIRKPIFLIFRTALLIALIVTAVAELSGSLDRSSGLFWTEGLGYRIFRSLDQARDDYLIASILTFSVLGLVAEQLLWAFWGLAGSIVLFRRKQLARSAYSRATATRLPANPALPEVDVAPRIEICDLTIRYNGKTPFSDLTLEVGGGETIAIVGRSGCGKTSLLKSVGGFVVEGMHVDGTIRFGGAPREHIKVGFIQQESFVFDTLTVWQNVTISERFRNRTEADFSAAVDTIEKFGLAHLIDREVGTLSGGERQRVSFATMLLNLSAVVLCDEPFASLDALTRRDLQLLYLNVFRGHHRPTVLWVTHDLEEAVIVADRVVSQLGPYPAIVSISKPVDPAGVKEWTLSNEFYQQVARVRVAAGLSE